MLLSLLIAACGGGGGGGGGGGAPCIVATVEFTAAPSSGNIGDQLQFRAVAKNAAGKVCGSVLLDWSASNPYLVPPNLPIVTIVSTGLATLHFDNNAGHYPANITITATLHNNPAIFNQTTLTVNNPVTSVDITSAPPPTLAPCESFQFTAVANTAPQSTITWSSSVPAVATISSSGVATALSAGSTQIIATAYGVDSIPPVTLTVAAGSGGVTITPSAVTIPAGSGDMFNATVLNFVADGSVTWSVDGGSSNGTVTPTGPNDTDYTAPVSVPIPSTVTLRATSNENTACSGTADVTVIPTFGAATEFGLGGGLNPQALVIGQFNLNNNANLGVAVANEGTNNVSVFIGNGDGTLQTPPSTVSTTPNSNPVSIAQGFFDQDVLPDLATANFASNDVAILLGAGAGSFNPATCDPPFTNCSVGTSPQSVAAGDFDNPSDGFDDLAIANFGSPDITILKSNGDGTFTVTQTIPIPAPVKRSCPDTSGPFAVATDFIDGDGNRDLAVADFSCDTVWVFKGNGDGTFLLTGISPVEMPLPIGTGPAAIVIADVNGDTFADLAVVNVGLIDDNCTLTPTSEANKVTIIIGKGDLTFYDYNSLIKQPITYPVGSNPRAIAVGDFNKDGSMDIVTANYCSDDISLLFGVGDGTFQSAVSYFLGSNSRPTSVAVGNLDSNTDAFVDLAVTDSGTDSVSVLLNNN